MIRRSVLLALLTLLAAEPAYSQEWLQRYLRERRPKRNPNAEAQASPTSQPSPSADPAFSPGEPEVRRALPADGTPSSPTVITAPGQGEPITAVEPEIRRALPADADQASPAGAPTPVVLPAATPMEVRRAELVPFATPTPKPTVAPQPTPAPTGSSIAPTPGTVASTPQKALPKIVAAVPAATPPPLTPAPKPSPSPSPTPTPVPDAPAIKPATPAQPAPAATTSPTQEASPVELDPKNSVITLSPNASGTTPPDVLQINYANDFYAKKQFDRSAPEYERYLSLYPRGADRQAAVFRLAESYRQIGNINAARQNYETLIFNYPDGEFVGAGAYRLADLCFQEKDYSAAVTFFRKASVRVKDPAIALSAKFYAARSLEAMKSASEAIAAYEDILTTKENNPFREASRLALAQVCAGCGRRMEAIQQLQALLTETDKDAVKAEASVRIGLLWIELNQNEKAVAMLGKALKMENLGDWKEPAEIGILRVLYNSGKFQQVLSTYESTGKEFSAAAVPEVLLIVANSNRQLGKNANARALYEQAIRDYPDTVYAKEAQYERLIALYSANAPELVKEVDAYLAQNPEASEKRDQLTLMKAESLYKTKHYASAAPLYAALEASTLAPGLKSEALFKLGWCYSQSNNADRSIDAFSRFLLRYPAHKLAPTALAQRALAYQQTKNFKAAVKDFDDLLNRYPERGVKERELAFQQKALILGQQQDNQAMADTFARLLKEYPTSKAAGQANYWIGWAAFENKNYKAAISPLATARKLDKEFAGKATLRIILANYYSQDRDATAAEVDAAEQASKAARTKVPAEVLRWLGMEYLKAENAKRAELYLGMLTGRSLIEKTDEATEDDWLNLGRARNKLGKWRDAQSALEVYLKEATEPVPQAFGYLALGEAQLGASDYVQAQQSADHVLQLQPEGRLNGQARMFSGDVAMARNDYDTAAKLFLSVSVVYDDPSITPRALEKAYRAYKAAGNDAQAAKVLNDLQSRFPEYQVSGVK